MTEPIEWTTSLDKIEMQDRAQIEALRAIADELRKLNEHADAARKGAAMRARGRSPAEVAQAILGGEALEDL